MPIRVHCPTGHVLMVPDSRAGTVVHCPKCKHAVLVPDVSKSAFAETTKVKTAAEQGGAPPPSVSPSPAPTTKMPRPPAEPPAGDKPALERPPTKSPRPAASPPLPTQAMPAVKTAAIPKPPVASPPPAPPPAPPPTPPPLPPPPIPPPVVSSPEPPPIIAPPPVSAAVVPPPVPLPAPSAAVPPPAPPAAVASMPAAATAETPAAPPTGLVPSRDQIAGAYLLSGVIVGVALFSLGPAGWEIFDYFRVGNGQSVAGWAYVLIMLAVLQIAYALFVAQLPDWSSAWVVSLASLLGAGAYGMLLGVTIVSGEGSRLIQTLQLDDKLTNHKAAMWSIAMICAMSLLSWFAGHTGARWHRAESVLKRSGLR